MTFRPLSTSLLLMFLFAALPGHAQDYLRYFQGISRAESLLVSGKERDALAVYDSLMQAYPWNDPADCYIASQLGIYLGDSAAAKTMLLRGLTNGLPLSTIQKNPRLIGLLRNDGRYALRLDEAATALADYHTEINPAAHNAALELIRKDQELIHNKPFGAIYEPGARRLAPAYVPIWDSLLNALLTYIKVYGFPAVKIAGTPAASDSMFREQPKTDYVLYIATHHRNAWPKLKEPLLAELHKGNITPRLYGAIAENSDATVDPENGPYFALRSCEFNKSRKACTRTVAPRLAAINEARAAIGLCSYEVMVQKEALKEAYQKWLHAGASGNPAAFDFAGVGWEPADQ